MHPDGFIVDRLPLCPGLGPAALQGRGRWLRPRLGLASPAFGRKVCSYVVDGPPQGSAVVLHHVAQRVADVAQQMPPVRDLKRVGRSRARSVRKGTGAVAGDHLDAGVLTQPGCQGVGPPVRQQVDDLVAFQVHQHRPVAVAAAPGPLINTQHLGRCQHRRGGLRNQPEQRIRAGRHGQPLGEARTGFSARSEADMALQIAEPGSALCPAQCGPKQRLGKGLAGTGRGWTAETPRMDPQLDGTALPRQVLQTALIGAVHALGLMAAAGASRHCRS